MIPRLTQTDERKDTRLAENNKYADLDRYISRLIAESTPERTAWNVEKRLENAPVKWNYIDGCMMTALLSMKEITGEQRYFDFVESFIGSFVREDGSIRTFDPDKHMLDDINEGRVLFDLYSATGKEKYRRAADVLRKALDHQPRTAEGSWWHKEVYPNQVWLDGIYMAQPFAALYEKHFGNGDYSDILKQVAIVRERMRDPKTGLYYHGYDAGKTAFWADRTTGLSRSFWLRAIGWFCTALADLCEIMPESETGLIRQTLSDLARDLLPFADAETGMYYQVVDQPGLEGNYLETSGSAMIAYAMLKGARLGILPPAMGEQGKKTFDGIVRTNLSFSGDTLNLDQICLVAGLGPEDNRRRDGSAAYYLSEPVVQNEAKGVAPLLMCYTEVRRI